MDKIYKASGYSSEIKVRMKGTVLLWQSERRRQDVNAALEATVGTRSTDGPLCQREFNTEQHSAATAVCALICATESKKGTGGLLWRGIAMEI